LSVKEIVMAYGYGKAMKPRKRVMPKKKKAKKKMKRRM
tara:strand:+ start:1112 stop:1225 length:114 start_codon:yes stop_codon:yes gene_type:complete